MSAHIQDTAHQDITIGPTQKRRRLWLLLVICALLMAGMAYTVVALAPSLTADSVLRRSDLRIATVERGDLVREVMAPGRVVVANSPTLFSPEQGYVELQIKAGDEVSKGQVLAIVASPQLREQLAREQAELTRMQVDLERQKIESQQRQLQLQQTLAMAAVQLKAMKRESRRAGDAYKLRIISQLDYEEVVDNLERAQLEYDQAMQNLALSGDSIAFYDRSLALQSASQELIIKALQRRVEALEVVSPVAGMVGNIQVEHKQAVTANQPLISVVDLTAYEVEAAISEGFAGEVAAGMQAQIRLNGDDYDGFVTAISPEVVGGQVTSRIRFVEDMPPKLRQNQRLTVRVLLENRPDTLMVERGAFFENFSGHAFKLVGDRAYRTPVTLGGRSLQHIEVSGGLEEGDAIIISAISAKSTDQEILINQ